MKNYFKKLAAILTAVAILALASAVFVLPASADVWDGEAVATSYAGGLGTAEDPYIISTAAQLAYLRAECINSSQSGVYFKLSDNISLADKPWTPIGDSNVTFGGIFDGNGKTISGLYSVVETNPDATSYAGVFGKTDGATIKNLTVTGSKILAKYCGPVVGLGVNTTVENCRTKVDLIDGAACGGIVGRTQTGPCKIFYCVSESTIRQTINIGAKNNSAKSDNYLGGIVGVAGGTEILYCANLGDIICDRGAITEANQSTKIYYAGGITSCVGASSQTATIKNCYNTGNISGYATLTTQTNCYAGGLVGKTEHVAGGMIADSFSTGTVTWLTDYNSGTEASGTFGGIAGIAAKASGTMSNLYSSMSILVGKNDAGADVSGLKTLTPEEMKGVDAVSKMNLGGGQETINPVSLAAMVDSAIEAINEKEAVIKAYDNYTGGKTLKDYVVAYVNEKLSGGSNATWIGEAGKVPTFGSYTSIVNSLEVEGTATTLINEAIVGIQEQYKADPANTTVAKTEDQKPTDTTPETTRVVIVVDPSTTLPATNNATPGTNQATDDVNDSKDSGCAGTISVIALMAAVISCGAAIIFIKKK